MVNWFRKDHKGNFLWPGYGENLRVLKWMLDRIDGRARGRATAVGVVPEPSELDLTGLEISSAQLNRVLAVEPDEWKAEMASSAEFFAKIGKSLPRALREKHQALSSAINGSGNSAPSAGLRA
jgi:phosphoenolpyruvate carboxykinase (GTP)